MQLNFTQYSQNQNGSKQQDERSISVINPQVIIKYRLITEDGVSLYGDIENVSTAIMAVTEAYPELKSDKNYNQLMKELSMTENLIAEHRSNYNKQIKEYNRYVRKRS